MLGKGITHSNFAGLVGFKPSLGLIEKIKIEKGHIGFFQTQSEKIKEKNIRKLKFRGSFKFKLKKFKTRDLFVK